MKLTIAALLALALAVLAAPASADQGRALLPAGYRMPVHQPDAAGARYAVALPDGGAVLFAWEGPGRGVAAVRMLPDGRRDPSFAAHVEAGGRTLSPTGALRRPDGRLVVTGSRLADLPSERDELIVAQLMPDGAPDPSFGKDGIARTGLSGYSGAALTPDGSLVLTGQDAAEHWAIARLTPAGAIDLERTVPGSRQRDDGRTGVRVAADGGITVLGGRGTRSLAARLLPDGSADPTWGGGAPVRVPVRASDFVLGDDGAVTALGETRVARLAADGTPDTAYGYVGVGDASFGRLLPEPGGGVLVYRTPGPQPRPAAAPSLVLDRLSATGARTRVVPKVRFGGGAAMLASRRTKPLKQNGFAAGQVVVRPDGSYLVAGGVSLIQYTGEGEGTSSARTAVVALTPDLRVDRSFGPRFAQPRIVVRPLGRRRQTFRVRVKASGPGLIALRLEDRRGHVVAAGLAPVHKAGRSIVRIRATRRHSRPVGFVATFRDLAGQTAGVAAMP